MLRSPESTVHVALNWSRIFSHHVQLKTSHTICIYVIERLHLFTHMCVRRLHGAFLCRLFTKTHTRYNPVLMVGICGQSSPLAPWHKNSHSRFHRALPWTAALLTRAQRFNYWPVSALEPHQLSHTGNCLSQCKGGNWIAGLLRGERTHIVPVCIC